MQQTILRAAGTVLAGALFSLIGWVTPALAEMGNGAKMDAHLSQIETLLTGAKSMQASCNVRREPCDTSPLCKGERSTLRDLLSLSSALDRYEQTLNAEDAALSRATDDAIANADFSAARLEGARIAANLTHMADQSLGALVELNGLLLFFTDVSNADPQSIWEAVKDINSVVNRVIDAQTVLEDEIESIYYRPGTKPSLPNVKAIEDAYIDIWSVPLHGANMENETREAIVETVKKNTSNAADIRSLINDSISLSNQLKNDKATTDELRKLINRFPNDRKKILQDQLKDFTAKQKSGDVSEMRKAKARMGLTLVNMGARIVQTYYVAEKLKQFRDKIQMLREEANRSGDPHLKLIEERDVIRQRARRVASLKNQTEITAQQLQSCALERCGGAGQTVSVISLPAIGQRKNSGQPQYATAQNQLEPVFTTLTRSLTQSLNGTTPAPEFPDYVIHSDAASESLGLESDCIGCNDTAREAEAIADALSLVKARLKQVEAELDAVNLNEMKAARKDALWKADRLQEIYLNQTDGSWSNWLENQTEDGVVNLSEIGSRIRRETTRARTLGQDIRRIERLMDQRETLQAQTEILAPKFRVAKVSLRLCNRKVCSDPSKASQVADYEYDPYKPDCPKDDADRRKNTDAEAPQTVIKSASSASRDGFVLTESFTSTKIPYWCNKPETGDKLVRCYLEFDKVSTGHCWVPEAVASAGVEDCNAMKAQYPEQNRD
jgi:hypothetical protein